MDGADSPSNSKVIVQCADPHHLFDNLEPRLSARSPLKNLHWKSPKRPLRSISNLNISLTREDKSVGPQSNVRRHQIPGLRETPYVKLYLLRCDDKETYKEKARKDVRQWVKAQTPGNDGKSTSKTQEDHDAFEWLIVHVVLPNTPAASQPRSFKSISLETADSTDSVNSKSKWSGKSSSTILDKLKADFNSSSKSPINRVAQVRLLEPNDKSTPLTPAELEEQWQDLVECLKACILRSFDARVSQYEADIRERDSQRNLPGWNFCTFFVLKEGLAKGFESVGLLEDALAVYDELSLGLDGLVKDQAQKHDNDDSGALLSFSKESKSLLRAALDPETRPVSPQNLDSNCELEHILTADRHSFPFDAERKNYRNLILSNDVSALDLRIYLFTREMEILTRQGRADLNASELTKTGANLNVIADLTERAVQFINLAARSLRLELYSAWGGQEGLTSEELLTQRTVTGNIVSTWEWRAVMQILGWVVPLLGMNLEYGTGTLTIDALELVDAKATDQAAETHSNVQRWSLTPDPRLSSRERSQERNNRNSVMPNGAHSQQVISRRPGFERLALWVSKLVIMARNTMETLEIVRPWVTEMKRITLNSAKENYMKAANGDLEVHSNSDKGDDNPTSSHKELIAGLESSTLMAAAASKSTFLTLYALLSTFAFRIITHTKSTTTRQQILIDLVQMEYAQGHHTVAARYLQSILGQLPRPSYRPADGHLLRMYADCLRHLDKPNDRARCLISCLQWISRGPFGSSFGISSSTKQHYADQLFEVVANVSAITLPLTNLFHISSVSRTISHHQGKDGFMLSVDLRPLSGISTPPLDDIRLRLASRDGNEPQHIHLKLFKKVPIEADGTKVLLETATTTHGWYTPDEVEVHIGNMRLVHHFASSHSDESAPSDEFFGIGSQIVPLLVYPCYRCLEVRIIPSPVFHLAEMRRFWVQIRPGLNTIKQCKLRLKTATAGLRLNIHDSKLLGDNQPSSTSLRTVREGDVLMILLENMESECTKEIEIPYTMEIQSEPSVTIRIDANYETDRGTFTLYDTAVVNIILPVTVNVQDVFRSSCMYSRFTISPSTLVPLHLISCKLEDNEAYDVVLGGGLDQGAVVFPKHPASWTVRLVPKHDSMVSSTQRLTLTVDFLSLDDIILTVLEEDFTSEVLKTPYAYAARLLVSHLLNRVRTTWTEQDLEVAGLSQEIEIWKMEDADWDSVLWAFDRKTRAGIEGWLQSWHRRVEPIKFTFAKTTRRQLRLHVDVNPPPVLVSASLEVEGLSRPARCTARIGQPMMAELILRLANSRETEVEGWFEVVAPSDSWLIGGRRKGSVQLSREPVQIPLVLFPQRLGPVLLPTITVKCRKQTKSSSGGADGWTEVPGDVYNAKLGRSIPVTPNLRSTTVEVFGAIPDEGMGRLVSSEMRDGRD
ncbi:uncharacterized protein Z518_11231 [Rhinocladiella mackenziei CBS 650.93]|uniref:TMEM1 family protein n=1 Tax=Rhinocladiella mackenziei CBS 650.93 TaxID=1442369 RepID=A0A0D2GMA5_9EURO|nr:uncharacterized protein Z518_11231 [Rhinocladiella mackenziei CBS 650.93]KIW99492.1 hypothetical protein Z518_11231 [Rhinocladiella mackenziei CBS 650.93]